jgi:hypothetical protein
MPIWGRDMVVAGGEQQTSMNVQTAQNRTQDTYLAGSRIEQESSERPKSSTRWHRKQEMRDVCE